MKKHDWKSFAELVGIAAVVASLVFVGLQLEQSQEIAIAEQYQNRSDSTLEFWTAMTQSDATIAYWATRMTRYVESDAPEAALVSAVEEYGAEQVAVRFFIFRSNITIFDNYHFQNEMGFMAEDAWQPFRERLKGLLSDRTNAVFYQDARHGLRHTFRDVCDEILLEVSTGQKRN